MDYEEFELSPAVFPSNKPTLIITFERNRRIPGLNTPSHETVKSLSKQFPGYDVELQFKLGIISHHFQLPKWVHKKKQSSFDLHGALANLQGNLAESIPSLTIWAPVSLQAVGSYHQANFGLHIPITRAYTIYTDGYDGADLNQFALATMGTIDSLDLRVHCNCEAELTLQQLLCEFPWEYF